MDRTNEFHQLCFNQARRRPQKKYEIEIEEIDQIRNEIQMIKACLDRRERNIRKPCNQNKEKYQTTDHVEQNILKHSNKDPSYDNEEYTLSDITSRLSHLTNILHSLRVRISHFPTPNCHFSEIKKSLEIFTIELMIEVNGANKRLDKQNNTGNREPDKQNQSKNRENATIYSTRTQKGDTNSQEENIHAQKNDHKYFDTRAHINESNHDQILQDKNTRPDIRTRNTHKTIHSDRMSSTGRVDNKISAHTSNRNTTIDYLHKDITHRADISNSAIKKEFFDKKSMVNKNTSMVYGKNRPSQSKIPAYELDQEQTSGTISEQRSDLSQMPYTRMRHQQRHVSDTKHRHMKESLQELGSLLTELSLHTHIQGENLLLICDKLKQTERQGALASINIREKIRRVKERRIIIMAIISGLIIFLLLIWLLR